MKASWLCHLKLDLVYVLTTRWQRLNALSRKVKEMSVSRNCVKKGKFIKIITFKGLTKSDIVYFGKDKILVVSTPTKHVMIIKFPFTSSFILLRNPKVISMAIKHYIHNFFYQFCRLFLPEHYFLPALMLMGFIFVVLLWSFTLFGHYV